MSKERFASAVDDDGDSILSTHVELDLDEAEKNRMVDTIK